MRSYIADAYDSINTLIQQCEQNEPIASVVWMVFTNLAQIKDFYHYVSQNFVDGAEKIYFDGEPSNPPNDSALKIFLLVRRVSRTLVHISTKSSRSERNLEKLRSHLNEIWLECQKVDDLINSDWRKTQDLEQHLSGYESLRIPKFELMLQYENVLYEREITIQRVDKVVDLRILMLYLQKCITEHSVLSVNGLIDDLPEFLQKCSLSNVQNQEVLFEKLNRLQIPLQNFIHDFQVDKRSMDEREALQRYFFRDRQVPDQSDEQILRKIAQKGVPTGSKDNNSISGILQRDRWIVLLGDAGNGKTTFARFLTLSFAVELQNLIQSSSNKSHISRRIPIFISLSSFVKESIEKESWCLLDYICHTKDSLVQGSGSMLKEEIIKGNCLLVLDGLDEVPTYTSRQKVMHDVQDFIERYTLSPTFVSPFDDPIYYKSLQQSLDGELPNEAKGNQLIITSRLVGYDSIPLIGPGIAHYIFLPLKLEDKNKFIEHWYLNVFQSIKEVMDIEGISYPQEHFFASEYTKNLKTVLLNDENLSLLSTNPMLLSMLCAWWYRRDGQSLPSLRIQFYHEAVASIVRSSFVLKKTTMSKDMITWILIDVASYMQEKEQSNLIDEYMLTRICLSSIKTWHEQKKPFIPWRKNFERDADEFVRLIDQDLGLLVARGEQLFGFIQLTFQEYFTCLRLVAATTNEKNIEQILQNLVTYIRNPRFRFSIFLSLEWLSWQWNSDNFNALCQQLIMNKSINQHLPLAAMILIETYGDLYEKPQQCILHSALDHFAQAHTRNHWYLHHPTLGERLCAGLEVLPPEQAAQWLLLYFQKASSDQIVDLCRLFYRFITEVDGNSHAGVPEWLNQNVCEFLANHIECDNEKNEYAVEMLLNLIAEKDHQRMNETQKNSSGLKMLMHNLSLDLNHIHPLILALIIAIHGGLHIELTNGVFLQTFNYQFLHRDSILAIPIAQCLARPDVSFDVKTDHILRRCESIIRQYGTDSVSLPVLDAFTAILCLKGIHDRNLRQDFKHHRGFTMALLRLKKTLFCLRRNYYLHYTSDFDDNEKSKTFVYENARNVIKAISQQLISNSQCSNVQIGPSTSISSESNINSRLYACINAISASLATLTLDGDTKERFHNDASEDYGQTLLKWKVFSCTDMEELKAIVLKNESLQTNDRNIMDLVWSRSMIIHTEEQICDRDLIYVHQRLLRSIHEGSHVFFHAMRHPLFLISFARPHRRALLLRLIETKELDINPIISNEFATKMAHVYLLTECLDDFPYKKSNNLLLFTFLILLLEPILTAHRLQNFAIVYFLRNILPDEFAKLKDYLDDDLSSFSWSQHIASLDESSVLACIAQEKQNITTVLSEIKSSQREFCLYAACVSLTRLSLLEFPQVRAMQDSLMEQVQSVAYEIDTVFYRIHALSFCCKLADLSLMENLPSLSYFAMVERVPVDDRSVYHIVNRLHNLLHERMNLENQRAVCEALWPFDFCRKYVLAYMDTWSWKQDVLLLSRMLDLLSPILYFELTNVNDLYYKNSTYSSLTMHACLYLASLALDAHTIQVQECEEEPDSSFSFDRVMCVLRNESERSWLTGFEAQTISQFLKRPAASSEIDLIDSELRLFEDSSSTAYSYLREWLQFHKIPQLKIFAWHAALLLPQDEVIPSSILVDLLEDTGYFRMKARRRRFTVMSLESSLKLADVIKGAIEAFRRNIDSIEHWILKTIIISRPEELMELFDGEQKLISEHLENNPSLLTLVAYKTIPVAPFLFEINSVLDDLSHRLLYNLVDRCLYVLSLIYCVKQSFKTAIHSSIEENLLNIVWQTIETRSGRTKRDQAVLRACTRLYYEQCQCIPENRLKVLQDIVFNSDCTDLHDFLTVICNDSKEKNEESTNTVMKSYCTSLNKLKTMKGLDKSIELKQLVEYIDKRREILLTTFITDLFRWMTITANRFAEVNWSSIYIDIAELLCYRSANDFLRAIQANSFGESRFKQLFYELRCRHLLSYYGELTHQLLELFFPSDLNLTIAKQIAEQSVPLIINITSRHVFEQLCEKLTSSFYVERFLAGKLLVQLSLCDVISVDEANDKIMVAMEDKYAKHQMKWFHVQDDFCPGHGSLAQELHTMLLQMSHIPTDPSRYAHKLNMDYCNQITADFFKAWIAQDSAMPLLDMIQSNNIEEAMDITRDKLNYLQDVGDDNDNDNISEDDDLTDILAQ